MLILPLLYNIVLKVLASTLSQAKEIKCIQIGEEGIKILFADDMLIYVGNAMKSIVELLE